MTWANVKRGDVVLEVYTGGRKRTISQGVVKSVGAKWITTARGKYQACNGFGEFGMSLHTEATLADHDAREAALRTIRECTSFGDRGKVPTDALVRAAAILRGEP
jgi:hypothetical protein